MTLLNVDLSTVTMAADVVFGIGDPVAEILHLDAQAGPSATKHRDVLAYNVLLHRQYGVAQTLIFHLNFDLISS
ncbi:MAG: hypothetical protein EA424_21825 [Planctomycetaceae bacterium]|nr:MAG: hypothetical protein EA424_21825 [Planctomycetaceae bacterium]